jgi:hypothetical protein
MIKHEYVRGCPKWHGIQIWPLEILGASKCLVNPSYLCFKKIGNVVHFCNEIFITFFKGRQANSSF